jgi:hypothetical protein
MVDFSLPSPPRRLEHHRRVLLDVQNLGILRRRTITVQRRRDAPDRLLRVSVRLSRLNLRSRLHLLRALLIRASATSEPVDTPRREHGGPHSDIQSTKGNENDGEYDG